MALSTLILLYYTYQGYRFSRSITPSVSAVPHWHGLLASSHSSYCNLRYNGLRSRGWKTRGGMDARDVPAPGWSVWAFRVLRRMELDPREHKPRSPAATNPAAASAKALGSNWNSEPQARDGLAGMPAGAQAGAEVPACSRPHRGWVLPRPLPALRLRPLLPSALRHPALALIALLLKDKRVQWCNESSWGLTARR